MWRGWILLAMMAAAAAPPLIPEQVARTVHDQGPVVAAARLTEAQFDRIVARAAHGQEPWLRLAADLLPGTDGARSEGIEGALSAALPVAPADVLRILDDNAARLPANRICEDRAIEPSRAAAKAFTVRATRAVRRVSDPSLRAVRDDCLASLRRTSAR